ncbi:MAG: hypothetical protein FJW27_18280 [Acidimicrobiia bacterium]|nr:hypothetical protein [Acidimicrobiia bacterium]
MDHASALRDAVDATLQTYADRGVFRGFSATDASGGLRHYRFIWLTRRPTKVTLAPQRRLLTFVRIFPDVARTPGVAPALKRALARVSDRPTPAHRRLDARRGTMATRSDGEDLSLRLTIASGTGVLAVKAALGVVNDLFQLLHECYPDYLATHFGISDE